MDSFPNPSFLEFFHFVCFPSTFSSHSCLQNLKSLKQTYQGIEWEKSELKLTI
ncbi:uncharacterized protein DS421_15g505880 [Arachis hypogaea]|nr:uncharacterized protein DS421_15g505880 [Arachis hypogaea]